MKSSALKPTERVQMGAAQVFMRSFTYIAYCAQQ
jgi:hypothetical protein